MAFEHVEILFPDGRKNGPVPWLQVVAWVDGARIPNGTLVRDTVTGEQRDLMSFSDIARLTTVVQSSAEDAVSGLIPYRNQSALIAYYLGVFSLIALVCALVPLLGVLALAMPVVALYLGVKGLKASKANPIVKGQVHAWIGIVMGSVILVLGIAAQILMIYVIYKDVGRH